MISDTDDDDDTRDTEERLVELEESGMSAEEARKALDEERAGKSPETKGKKAKVTPVEALACAVKESVDNQKLQATSSLSLEKQRLDFQEKQLDEQRAAREQNGAMEKARIELAKGDQAIRLKELELLAKNNSDRDQTMVAMNQNMTALLGAFLAKMS